MNENESLHLFLLILLLFFGVVALLKEAGEEDEKKDSVSTDPPCEYGGEIAINEEQLESVSEDANKLDL